MAAAAADADGATTNQGYTGGKHGKRANIRRGPCLWEKDYLVAQPAYRPSQFRNRFRIPLNLFRRFHHDLPPLYPDLQQKVDAVGYRGGKSSKKILVSLKCLGLGISYEYLDDQARMSSESIRRAFRSFCNAVRQHYCPEFLNCEPLVTELRAIERQFAPNFFPGCIGSVDCLTVKWKNCPRPWKEQYNNPCHGKLASISVQELCDQDLYCWNLYVGRPATNIDLTVVENSILSGVFLMARVG